jgi:hypothetical protein
MYFSEGGKQEEGKQPEKQKEKAKKRRTERFLRCLFVLGGDKFLSLFLSLSL